LHEQHTRRNFGRDLSDAPSPDGEVALRYTLETHGDMRAQ
jgi:hypothetical protein